MPVERSKQCHTESVGGVFFILKNHLFVMDMNERSGLLASFFWLDALFLSDLNAFLHCLQCYLLQSFGLIMYQ